VRDDWIEHRRGLDGELLGWMRPADDGFVVIDPVAAGAAGGGVHPDRAGEAGRLGRHDRPAGLLRAAVPAGRISSTARGWTGPGGELTREAVLFDPRGGAFLPASMLNGSMTTDPYFWLEMFYIGLLGLASIAIVWVSAIVVLRLFRGQR
jgi:hypothetical protein